ncbi:MAG: glycosyltransferase [Deltaproteobacteria bacterium]|nr:glycosyltransferase [Deltaproteobacteria bacterium]
MDQENFRPYTSTSDVSIVFFSYYKFKPGYMEQVLENVFSKEIGGFCRVIFLLQTDIRLKRNYKWNNAEVWPTPGVTSLGYLGKLLSMVLSLNKFIQFFRILLGERYVIAFVRDQPVVGAFLGFFATRLGYRYFFQYSAPLGEMRLASCKGRKKIRNYLNGFSGILHQFFLGFALKKAEIVFPITESFGHQLVQKYGVLNCIPLTMGVDGDWLKRRPRRLQQFDDLTRESFVIGYFGTLNLLRKPDFMIRVLQVVKRSVPECKLLVMGEFAYPEDKEKLLAICADLGVERDVIFVGNLDKESLQDHLQYCSLTLSAIPPVAYYSISSPTKIYESLAHGIPVVANSGIFEQEKVLKESGGGLLAEYDVNLFAEAVIKLYQEPEKRISMGKRGSEYVLKHYSYSEIARMIAPYFFNK